ncbi:hypothetical protein [Petroclostridium sp. X23]|uniref:hypothetical protein n=1 Tax=Petroclostridium sp. X23 TaxID=3045146 RepID=UPI0024AD25BC|nr:hypothetical protein [Petroclostridium sp. X23]WHH56947.1 hypothetical protein QKW49_13930 [Petroclostridium sp. X23]
MRKYHWRMYLIYILIILCYLIGSSWILGVQKEQASKMFDPFPFMVWSTVIFIMLGILLGLEHLLLEIKKEGQWELNLPKIILLGIPLFYLAMSYFIYYFPTSSVTVQEILSYPIRFILCSRMSQTYMGIFQVMLGYIIITSFYKMQDS